jgi:hypothetical protein
MKKQITLGIYFPRISDFGFINNTCMLAGYLGGLIIVFVEQFVSG